MSILGIAAKPKTAAPVRMWLYGGPNAGKTHLAVNGPNTLLLSTDGNHVYFPDVPANVLVNWEASRLNKEVSHQGESFSSIIEALKKDTTYDTIVLDLVEGAHRLARNHYLKGFNVVHEQDVGGWGKAWTVIREGFISAIEQLFKLPKNIIIISHEARTTIKPKSGPEYTVFSPKLDDYFHETIEGYCNIVARVYSTVNDEGVSVRMLSLSPKDNEFGINRLGQVEDLELVHNGDVWGDFYKVYSKLYEERGLNMKAVNKVRILAEKDTKEGKQEETKKELEQRINSAKAALEEKAETIVEEPSDIETPAQKIARLKAEKEAAKNVKVEEPKVEPVKEEITEDKEDEPIDDGEPTIDVSDETAAKLARIAEIRRNAMANKK